MRISLLQLFTTGWCVWAPVLVSLHPDESGAQVHPSRGLSLSISVCMGCLCLSVCLSLILSVYQFLAVTLYVCFCICVFIYRFWCLCTSLSLCLSALTHPLSLRPPSSITSGKKAEFEEQEHRQEGNRESIHHHLCQGADSRGN
jgi:hypothetical protein